MKSLLQLRARGDLWPSSARELLWNRLVNTRPRWSRCASGLLAGAVVLLLVGLPAQATAADEAGPFAARVTRVTGKAQYRSESQAWQIVKVGDRFSAGVCVQTAPENSSVDLQFGHAGSAESGIEANVVRLLADTALVIERLSAQGAGREETQTIELDLRAGRIVGAINGLPGTSEYNVKIPAGFVGLQGGVPGGQGTVYVLSSSGSLAVLSGKLVIALASQRVVTQVVNGGQQFDPATAQITSLPPNAPERRLWPLERPGLLRSLVNAWAGEAEGPQGSPLRFTAEKAPQRTNAPVKVPNERVNEAVTQLNGVVLLGSHEELKQAGVANSPGVTVKGPAFLSEKQDAVKKLVLPYLSKPLTRLTMDRLQTDIILLCRRLDRPVVDVFYPQQEVLGGTIQIIVFEGKVGALSVLNKGKKWFSDRFITNRIHLVPGGSISQKQLLQDLERLNRNPAFREVNVSYKQAQFTRTNAAATDVDIIVKDRFPLRVLAGYDNHSIKVLGEDRLFAGFSYGNLFGLDHQVNYQYATDLSLDRLRAHSASYVAPLPWWGHTLTLFGGYNEVNADLSQVGFPTINNSGHTYQLSARYTAPLPHWLKLSHELSAGFDFKYANTLVGFDKFPLPAFRADVDQFVLEYRALSRDPLGYSQVLLSGYYSPGGLVGLNSDHDFATFHSGLKTDYSYGRLNAERGFWLPGDFLVLGRGTYQRASTGLLPSEQLYLGGYSALRGYPELVVSDDEGWYGSLELHSPLLRPSDLIGRKYGDSLDLYGFYDYGAVNPHDSSPSNPSRSSTILASAGAGLSLRVRHNLDVSVAYGFELRDLPVTTPQALRQGKSCAHIAATLTF